MRIACYGYRDGLTQAVVYLTQEEADRVARFGPTHVVVLAEKTRMLTIREDPNGNAIVPNVGRSGYPFRLLQRLQDARDAKQTFKFSVTHVHQLAWNGNAVTGVWDLPAPMRVIQAPIKIKATPTLEEVRLAVKAINSWQQSCDPKLVLSVLPEGTLQALIALD